MQISSTPKYIRRRFFNFVLYKCFCFILFYPTTRLSSYFSTTYIHIHCDVKKEVTVLIVKSNSLFRWWSGFILEGRFWRSTDSSKPLRSIKETIKSAWHVPLEQQDLYSDKLKLSDDDATSIWRVALGNRHASEKPSVSKTLEKLKDWHITLKIGIVQRKMVIKGVLFLFFTLFWYSLSWQVVRAVAVISTD